MPVGSHQHDRVKRIIALLLVARHRAMLMPVGVEMGGSSRRQHPGPPLVGGGRPELLELVKRPRAERDEYGVGELSDNPLRGGVELVKRATDSGGHRLG